VAVASAKAAAMSSPPKTSVLHPESCEVEIAQALAVPGLFEPTNHPFRDVSSSLDLAVEQVAQAEATGDT
jgi:hypothetical protein